MVLVGKQVFKVFKLNRDRSSLCDNITTASQPTEDLLPKLSFRFTTLYDSLGSKRSAGDVGVILVGGSFM